MEEQEAPQTEGQETQEEKEQTGPDIAALFDNLDDSPDEDQIEKWKEQFGDVFVFGLSNTEIFIFKAISREEYRVIQGQVQDAQTNGIAISDELIEDAMFEKCVLYSSKEAQAALTTKAGTAKTLNDQILLNSYFISPQTASEFVIKL